MVINENNPKMVPSRLKIMLKPINFL